MAPVLDLIRLTEALSPDDPCGPDLETESDLDFLNGLSHVESLLPTAFFSRDEEGRQQPFDRSAIDFPRETKRLLALLDRTRDLRVLALLARLAILDRSLPDFASTLTAIARLLEQHWQAVHPRGESGDFALRIAVLQAIDDTPTVILPLQHVVLAQSRRYGAVTFRSVMVADGEIPPRPDEPVPDRGAIERAVADADPESLAAQIEALSAVEAAVAAILAVTLAQGGYEQSVNLERLGALTGRIRAFLATIVAGAGSPPAAAPPASAESAPEGASDRAAALPPASRGPRRLTTIAEASAALAAAGRYLRGMEPSSPAEVLVRQAQMLVGRSFIEVMRILVPAYASEATIAIGASRSLRLSFDQLSSVPEGEDDSERDAPAVVAPETDAPSPEEVTATSRAEALALIRDAAAFYRSHEPSSPIPLLLDKAAAMADRDFLTILRDVLPDLGST